MLRIAIASEKGGVGKTTLTSNLAVLLGERGPTLAVDCDPQGSLTASFGVEHRTRSLADLLQDAEDVPLEDVLVSGVAKNVDLLPASRAALEDAERRLTTEPGGEGFLRRSLEQVTDRYDWVVMDTPASLSILTLNAVCAADHVLGVYISQPWSMRGAGVVSAFVDKHKRRGLTTANFLGLVNNMAEPRLVLSRAVDEAVSAGGLRVFATKVPRSVRVAEAAALYSPVVLSDPSGTGALALRALAEEIVTAVGES